MLRRWVLVMAVLVGSCAGTGSVPTEPVTTEAAATSIIAEDFRFVPATVEVAPGGSIELQNRGGVTHTWTVLSTTIEQESDLAPDLVLVEARAETGSSARADLTGIAPGRYQVVCSVPGHVTAGMVGELVISG